MMEILGRVAERVLTAILEIPAWVSSLGSRELLLIGGAVLVGMLAYQFLRR